MASLALRAAFAGFPVTPDVAVFPPAFADPVQTGWARSEAVWHSAAAQAADLAAVLWAILAVAQSGWVVQVRSEVVRCLAAARARQGLEILVPSTPLRRRRTRLVRGPNLKTQLSLRLL